MYINGGFRDRPIYARYVGRTPRASKGGRRLEKKICIYQIRIHDLSMPLEPLKLFPQETNTQRDHRGNRRRGCAHSFPPPELESQEE